MTFLILHWLETMTEQNVKRLINKYKTKQKGEKWSKESEVKEVQEWRANEVRRIATSFMDDFNLHGTQKKEVLNILDEIKTSELYRHTKQEIIILVICLYVKKSTDKRYSANILPENYSICREYGLDSKIAYNITTRLLTCYRKKNPLKVINEI